MTNTKKIWTAPKTSPRETLGSVTRIFIEVPLSQKKVKMPT